MTRTDDNKVVPFPAKPPRQTEPEFETISLSRDGNMICALVGRDLQVGVAGFGKTTPEALRDLADNLEREGTSPFRENPSTK